MNASKVDNNDKLVQGQLVRGHQIASGRNPNSPYPAGSIALQIPFFKQRGLDLSDYYSATLNVSVAPKILQWRQPCHQFEQLDWIASIPSETFWFAPCDIVFADVSYPGWIYYPHPDTKTQHFHDASLVEVICQQKISAIQYGDELSLRYGSQYVDFVTPTS